LIEWGGALRWLLAADHADPQRVRAWAASLGGHATLYRSRDKSKDAGQPLSQTVHTLPQRPKIEFDPHGVFNRGRLYPL
ncbi:MAG: glycolate oxidase subunit GlcE, partial [Casimicrobiaceae bacterium]